MPAKNLVQISAYLKRGTKEKLELDALREGRTLASEIRLIIEREVERRESGKR